MKKSLELLDELNVYLENNNYLNLTTCLKKVFKLERDSSGAPLQYEFSQEAITFLHNAILKCNENKNQKGSKDAVKEVFRSLRNYVINSQVQHYLIHNNNFLKDVKKMFCLNPETEFEVFPMILQFLINLLITDKSCAPKLCDLFLDETCQLLDKNICLYESSAFLYNLILHKKDLKFEGNFYNHLLTLYEKNDELEYLHFIIETFITSDDFWCHYKNLNLNHRLILLGIIRNKQIKGEELKLSKQGLKTLSSAFVNSGTVIFQTASLADDHLEPYEVSQLLQVISSLCGNETYLEFMKNDKDLLINSGVLLINIHRLGKESKNNFTSIQSLSELRAPEKSIAEHPAFGFKADLVRIIGNLCWKNKIMQDLAREAELIPIILDCCNMDARNPFIMQWAILAIRNLCENNLENQRIVAGLHQEGTVSTTVLEEMGLTLNSDDNNSIKIVPLDALRNKK